MNQKRIYLSLLFFLFISYSQAAIIYVDNDSQGNNTGQTWADAYHDLSTALTNANFGDVIRIDKGTYIAPNGGFVLKDGVKIYGGYNVRYNNGTIIPEWMINFTRFFDDVVTNLEGNSVFFANQTLSDQSIIDGLILTSNDTSQYSLPIIRLGLNNITFSPKITNCTFRSILSTSSFSTAIGTAFNGATFSGSFNPTFNGCNIETTMGIEIPFGTNSSLHLSINRTSFKNTSANSSRNIAMKLTSNTTTFSTQPRISIDNSFIGNNRGLYIKFNNVISDIKINNSIFASLSSTYNALPLELQSSCSVNVDNTTFHNISNIIWVYGQNVTSASRFDNCIIIHRGIGGGVAAYSGVYNFNNCLFNRTVCPTSIFGGVITCNNSLYGQNPQFVSTDPASTDYLKLSANSPARNAGDNNYATGTAYGGNSRILEGTVDIGAYEFCPDGVACQGTTGGITPRKIATKHLENTTNDLLVYPNPIQDVVKVKSKDKILAIDILNVQGQVVSSVQNSNTIKLNNVAKGMYLLKVTTDKGIQTKRIVKE